MVESTLTGAGLRIPEGAVLLHIGPHKTGTTAVQAALFTARDALEAQGVIHAGHSRNPAAAAQAVVGRASPFGGSAPPMRHWNTLAAGVRRAHDRRVVLSSEFLAYATPDAVRRVVDDLGPDRVHVVVTLRPLARIIPSMWQQNVQAGRTDSLDAWLRRLFPSQGPSRADAFWTLHRHDRLAARWAEVVGRDRVIALVVDGGDRGWVLRAFEQLLGLAEGTLPAVSGLANRSLSWDEAEALRAFNEAYRQAGHAKALYARAIRFGAALHLGRQAPLPDDRPITLPAWSWDAIGVASRSIADGLRETGVRIVGDLEALGRLPGPGPDAGGVAPADVEPAVAARLAMAIAVASGRTRTPLAATEEEIRDAMTVVATRQLLGALGVRAGAAGGHLRRRAARRAVTAAGRGVILARAVRRVPPGSAAREPGALPAGSILLHIGPPKTGTTAIQGAFHACRDGLERQGVHYAGARRHSITAVQAALGRRSFYADEPPPIRAWQALRDEILRSRAHRIVLSSEFLADGPTDRIRAVVDELGVERVHVVVTLRPLARIIPSQWQQYVQSGSRQPYEPWLDVMLNGDGHVSPSFWRRHRVDSLVARWAEVVGADRLIAIVLDEADRSAVLRTFERLLGVRDGTLQLHHDTANRSLTAPEIEAVRALNHQIFAAGLGRGFQTSIVHFGTAEFLKRVPPDPSSPTVDLPGWAVPRVSEIEAEMVAGIAASGVTVIGDLDRLTEVRTSGRSGFEGGPVRVPVEVAARLAMGVLYATGLAAEPRPGARSIPIAGRAVVRFAEPIEVARVPTGRLVRELAVRSRGAVARRVGRKVADGH